MLGVLLCYAQFLFGPSGPPPVAFAGQDLPGFDPVVRRFNLRMLGNYGIHTSVFPSTHVGGAFAAAFGMRRAAPGHSWPTRFFVCSGSPHRRRDRLRQIPLCGGCGGGLPNCKVRIGVLMTR